MNHTKCTVNTFRNRLWPFNRTRSDKNIQFLPDFCCFFGGLIFQITCELYFQGCSVVYPPPKNFSTTKQLPPEESGSTRQFALQQATTKSSKPDGPAAGKTPAEVTRPSRRYFQDLDCGQTFFSLPPTGRCDQIQCFFLGCQAPTPYAGPNQKFGPVFKVLQHESFHCFRIQ